MVAIAGREAFHVSRRPTVNGRSRTTRVEPPSPFVKEQTKPVSAWYYSGSTSSYSFGNALSMHVLTTPRLPPDIVLMLRMLSNFLLLIVIVPPYFSEERSI